jgi:two-component system cell cycle sensor histidine kinase/response regulator CckA
MGDAGGKRASAELLWALIESLPVMVFVKDAVELRFELVNRACEDILGLPCEELIGLNDHDLFPRQQAEFFETRDRVTLAPPGLVDVTEEPVSTWCGERWVRTTRTVIRDESGAQHLLGITEDITAQQELVRALRRTEEMLRKVQRVDAMGKLAVGIAHDFNNLLSGIIGCADAAKAAVGDEDPVRAEMEEILRAGERGAELTRRLLRFTRGEAAPSQVLDLNDLVAGMRKMVRHLVEENVRLNVALASSLWMVSARPSDVEQLLMNLVVNARDAMPRGGTLTIETANVEIDGAFALKHPDATRGPHVMLAVSDTGTGMDRETTARAFEAFFTTKPTAAGLGLWNVHDTVHRLGGTVLVHSELGAGTTFEVFLPRAESLPAPRSASEPPAVSPKRGNETILVVEDEELLLRVLCGVLRRNGYAVLGASSPAEALLLSEQHAGTIDLLVTDVVMPLLSGWELAEWLRRTRPAMKVAFMSGYADDVVERHVLLGSKPVLIQKPFSTSTLVQKIREALPSGS